MVKDEDIEFRVKNGLFPSMHVIEDPKLNDNFLRNLALIFVSLYDIDIFNPNF